METLDQIAEIIGGDDAALAELHQLADANGGDLTPDIVLDSARPSDSPLHKHFEWDDSVAAEQYRRNQARTLLRAYRLRIVDSAGERTVRYWTNVIREDQHVYKRTQEVVQIETLRQQRRLAIMRDLNRIRGELATFDSLGEALTLVDDALAIMRGDVK